MRERHSLILAHPDDDLVFMCPTLLQVLRAGHAVQSIYLTAGDAGRPQDYWLAREAGMVAAYAEACGLHAEHFVQEVQGNVASRTAAAGRIRLNFLRLPDGMLDAQGSAPSGHTSLPQLWQGRCATLQALDHSARYTRERLLARLVELLQEQVPHTLHMLNPGPLAPREHPDHQAAALFAQAAAAALSTPPQLRAYVGSNSPTQPANVGAAALAEKQRVFAAYARFDTEIDRENNIYQPMLAREYWMTLRPL